MPAIQGAYKNGVLFYPISIFDAILDSRTRKSLTSVIDKLRRDLDAGDEQLSIAIGLTNDAVAAIQAKIPLQASADNQLADKQFVNSGIATATATFRGTYNLVSDLSLTVSATDEEIAEALGSTIATADNNDYSFVQVPTADATPTEIAVVKRFKFNGTAWGFEFSLNNSGFTAAQWAAINSGITPALVIAFGNKYDKPGTGIPKTDLSSDVQSSLDKADTALQTHQDISGKADITYVNDAISTATADFKGTFTSQAAMDAVTANANDYAYLVTTDSAGNTVYNRYKWVDDETTPANSGWVFEYSLNNSSFTSTEWAAIQSGITQQLVARLGELDQLVGNQVLVGLEMDAYGNLIGVYNTLPQQNQQ